MKCLVVMVTVLFSLFSCNDRHQPLDLQLKQVSDRPGVKPGSGPSGEPIEKEITFTQIKKIFAEKCIACHIKGGIGAIATGLILDNDSAYDGLLKYSRQKPSVRRVSANNSSPKESYLVAKIIKAATDRDNQRMPLGGTLSDDKIKMIKDWIDAGAKDN